MPRSTINDEERRQWVANDEGLYSLMCSAVRYKEAKNQTEWIRKNRALIDEVINNVTGNKQPAHYLKYGGNR